MHTTLNAIRQYRPCADGWAKLLSHLSKTAPDDEPLALTTILDANGLEDAIWALRSIDGHDRQIRLFAVACARQVQHLMKDPRSIAALDVAERYANGQCTEEEMSAARQAAIDAYAAAYAADYRAYNAAYLADCYAYNATYLADCTADARAKILDKQTALFSEFFADVQKGD